MTDAARIRDELINALAEIQRIPRPSAVNLIKETIAVLELRPLLQRYIMRKYGQRNLASLTDQQLWEVVVWVNTLAAAAESARAIDEDFEA